jgi:exopolysaccharide biosynthesis polyprenyl glycosylphosphotransferase
MSYAATNHIGYQFVPNQLGIFAAHSEINTMAGMPIVSIRRTPLEGWGRILKRAFDLVASLLGLIILSPLFLLIALAIKLTDPGPVFYRHKRLSRSGQYISIFKFRTMKEKYSTGKGFSGKTDADIFRELGRPELVEEFAKEQKLKNDPRVSAVGSYLRRTSLDELPQLINILVGDISLVGPRPIVDAELEKYGVEQSKLFALRPGLTGLWQVSGRNDIGYDERVKLDIYYIENWSLGLDIKIILRTIWIVLTRRGAY